MIVARHTIRLAALLALLTPAAPTIEAQIIEAKLKVKGLACPFCSYGLERKLKKLPGVHDIEILMNADLATLRFDGKESPDIRDFDKAVRQAGFKLADLRLTVRAKLTRHTGQSGLGLPDGKILLVDEAGLGRELSTSVAEGTTLEATGSLLPARSSGDHATPRLQVDSYEVEKIRPKLGRRRE